MSTAQQTDSDMGACAYVISSMYTTTLQAEWVNSISNAVMIDIGVTVQSSEVKFTLNEQWNQIIHPVFSLDWFPVSKF